MSEVVVKAVCLLQLFQRCLKCCSDECSISTGQEGPVLHVVQQCWSCGNSREWKSQLPPGPDNPETVEEPLVISENTVMDIEEKKDDEEEEEDDDNGMTEQEEEEEEEKEVENQKTKRGRKRRRSDDEWLPNMGEVLETSDEESDSQSEEDNCPDQVAWCSDCGKETSATCLLQEHLLLYCCVQCGYRDGYQEPESEGLQETRRISSLVTLSAEHQDESGDVSQAAESSCNPETPSAGHQEGSGDVSQAAESSCNPETPSAGHQDESGDVSQAAESSCSPETDSNNKQCPSSDCPEDASICSIQEGSISKTGEHISSSSQEDNLSMNQSSRCQQEVNAASQENQNSPMYKVYFKDPYSLQSHVEDAHRHKRELCPDCGRFMFRRDGRSGHVCDYKGKPFTCLTCGKKYTCELKLRIHSQVHSEEYRISCQYCYKTFKHKEDKQQHEETHKEERLKFHCPDCPKRFRSKQNRKDHLLDTHWKDGRFVCKVCDRSFSRAGGLKRHEAVHTGEKAYSCDVCDRSFNQPGHLKSHMRVHTGEKPFKCQDCGQCFNHNVSLRNHIQRNHRPESLGEGRKGERGVDLSTASDSSDKD